MSANHNGPGGVRNLRAMFENKSTDLSTSPPSRGRSPAEPDLPGPARPVSKVRASFVAVERPGELGQAPQWGLRKTSDVDSLERSKGEAMNGTSEGHVNGKSGEHELQASLSRPQLSNGAKEQNGAASWSQEETSTTGGLGAILKGSAFEPAESVPQPAVSTTNANTSSKIQGKPSQLPKINGTSSKASGSTGPKTKEESHAQKPKSSVTGQLNTAQATGSSHPPPSEVQPEPKTKSPTVRSPPTHSSKTATASHLRIKGGPGKIQAVVGSAQNAREAHERSAAANVEPDRPHLSDQVDGPAPTSSGNGTKTEAKPPAKTTPKPKPPTQPGRLPAVATASTAASSARKDAGHSPVTSTSTRSPADRKSSATRNDKTIPRAAGTTTASSLAKSRASLPAQTTSNARPKSRVSTAADESFLARMTRPTAASERRAHEKIIKPDSPPRVRKDIANSKPKAHVKKMTVPTTQTHDGDQHGETTENGAAASTSRTTAPADAGHESSPNSSQVDDRQQQPAAAAVTQDAT